ncbi:ATP-binding cassette domain-containing protein [Candidatus Entotheonella palauensis]|uniref:ATP-binding cassette domain-containing protein n=1 Tax=Candidatus Entotheonella palauensis TaxID=93172 RepID=UPI000B7F5B2C|nr:ATP-binding cassette domain-containing protein [Candidatus Entotheonella palauensis]
MISLTYDALSLRVGRSPVLDRIDLDLTGPGVVALLGPSGVGKSSLLRATQRLIDHGQEGWKRSGDVRLNGESIFASHIKKHELARWMGFIQQKPRMLGGSARNNVEFALRHTTNLPRAAVRQKAEAALEQVGLTTELDSLDMAAWQLSGGQAQRLAIARAIALEPAVLLMDEPSSALDPLSSQRVESIIRTLAETRLVVMVTHAVSLAERLADVVAFLWRGESGARLVEYGDVSTVLGAPRDLWVRQFVWTARGHSHGEPAVAAHSATVETHPILAGQSGFALLQRVYLFVCSGNRSRSPIAQTICHAEVSRLLQGVPKQSQWGRFQALSAGLSASYGAPMSTAARTALGSLGVPPPDHVTQPVTEDLVRQADTIYCMTEAQCRELTQRFPAASAKTQRLDPVDDIADPEGGDAEAFTITAERIRDLVRWRLESQGQFPLPVTWAEAVPDASSSAVTA